MKRFVAISSVLILLMATGAIGLNHFLTTRDSLLWMKAESMLIFRLDSVLNEARKAAIQVEPLTEDICSLELSRQLKEQAHLYPHVRDIHLLKGDKTYCSSAFFPLPLSEIKEGESLQLLPETPAFPGTPAIVYVKKKKEDGVAITTDLSGLDSLLDDGQLAVVINGYSLSNGKVAREQKAVPAWANKRSSIMFDYDVAQASLMKGKISWKSILALAFLIAGVVLLTTVAYRYYRRVLSFQGRLLHAIQTGKVVPWYQPIMDSTTGSIYGAEILARWKTSDGTMIAPDVFIPLAEKSDMLVTMTQKLLKQMEQDLLTLKPHLPESFHISINLSARKTTIADMLDSLLHFHQQFSGHVQLVLELTEREEVVIDNELIEMINTLRRSGINVALDDFGTGHSNLGRLAEIPVDIIKVDKLFVKPLSPHSEGPYFVDDIIRIAKPRGITLIAEGVESVYQRDYLNTCGITLQQGYLWSAPLSADNFLHFMVNSSN